jgi:hypothetical protein
MRCNGQAACVRGRSMQSPRGIDSWGELGRIAGLRSGRCELVSVLALRAGLCKTVPPRLSLSLCSALVVWGRPARAWGRY